MEKETNNKHLINSPANAFSKKNAYQVPEDYFIAFPDKMLQSVKKINYPGIGINKNMPFQLPKDYFEKFSQGILDTVREKKRIQGPFKVPENYFEKFPEQIKVLQDQKKHAFNKRKWIKWCMSGTAALLAGIITLSYLHFATVNNRIPTIDSQKNSQITSRVKLISNTTLINYLDRDAIANTFDPSPNSFPEKKPEVAKEVEDKLSRISNQELKDYMQQQDDVTEQQASYANE